MREILVDPPQLRLVAQMADELLAHPDQRRSAARCKVQAPQQFLAARLGGAVQCLHRPGRVGSLLQGGQSGLHRLRVGAEIIGQCPKEGQPPLRPRILKSRQQGTRNHHARGLSAPRQEARAQLRQIRGREPVAPDPCAPAHKAPATFAQALKQIAQQRRAG